MLDVIAQSSLTINVVGGGLVAFGIALFVVTISFWRTAPADPEVLAPLEVMDDREFVRATPEERVSLLNRFRPRGAARITRIEAPSQLLRAPENDRVEEFSDVDTYDDDDVEVPAVIDPLLRGTQQQGDVRSPYDPRSPRRN